MSTFRGRYFHTIDEKGRIIFPSRLRDIIEQEYDNHLVVTAWGDYLMVFPFTEWQLIEEKISQKSIIDKKVRRFQRLFMSGAVDCSLDNQGRILIPPSLREHAKLEKDVVITGMIKVIEIWNKDRFLAEIAETEKNIDEYGAYAADLGL